MWRRQKLLTNSDYYHTDFGVPDGTPFYFKGIAQ